MQKISSPEPGEFAPYYQRYIDLVRGETLSALATQHGATHRLLASLDEARAMHRYASGKWTVKGVLGHITDSERVFAYRALCIARSDVTPLPGFDENAWASEAGFDARPISDLVSEFAAVRAATLALFHGLSDDTATRVGTANDQRISVRALAAIIAGHEVHHVGVLRERYALG